MWVLNSDEQFDRAMYVGVDGIMTDYPVKLAEYMRRNGHLAETVQETNDNYHTFDSVEDKWSQTSTASKALSDLAEIKIHLHLGVKERLLILIFKGTIWS